MGKLFTAKEFCTKALEIAHDYKTIYVKGCFGAPMTDANKKRYTTNHDYNKTRADLINKADSSTYGFDCVCLIKGIAWGWSGMKNRVYGGATYASNEVPDFGTEGMLDICDMKSDDFSTIPEGAMVWTPGHCGIYVGDGQVVESTPKWDNGVQITICQNIRPASVNEKARYWKKWGTLPFVKYVPDIEEGMIPVIVDNKITYVHGVVTNGRTLVWLMDVLAMGNISGVTYNQELGLAQITTKG